MSYPFPGVASLHRFASGLVRWEKARRANILQETRYLFMGEAQRKRDVVHCCREDDLLLFSSDRGLFTSANSQRDQRFYV